MTRPLTGHYWCGSSYNVKLCSRLHVKQGGATGESGAKRKPWIKKTPVEIILEQVAKQEEKVAALRKELAKEEGELKKMQDATKLLQAK